MPKIIKVGGNLTKLWQNNFAQFFWDTVYYGYHTRDHPYKLIKKHSTIQYPQQTNFFQWTCH